MRNLILLGVITLTLNSFGQIVPVSSLDSENNTFLYNGRLYSGDVVDYFSNGQVKNYYSVKDGLLDGTFESYHYDNSFKKSLFIDTALLAITNLEITRTEDMISKLESDKSVMSLEMNDFVKNKIGGSKKLEKLQEKNDKGKLKGEKKQIYLTYVDKEKSIVRCGNDISRLTENLKILNEKIIKEKNKPIYTPQKSVIYNNKEGLKSGEYQKYSKNGNLIEKGNYTQGFMNGKWTYYHTNGELKAVGNYNMGDGSDVVKSSSVPLNNRDGLWEFYYPDGTPEQTGTFKSGEIHGKYILYFENGKVEEESYLIHGKYDGVKKVYYQNGILKEEMNYTNGLLSGTSKEFHENGNIKTSGFFDNNKLDGVFKEFYDNGKIKVESTYVRGTAHGPVKSYFENGKVHYKGIIDTTSLTDNKVFGDFYEYNEDGSLKVHGYIDRSGNVTDKTPKKRTKLNTAEINKPYRCKCCKKKIYGLKDGVGTDGDSYLSVMAEIYLTDPFVVMATVLGYKNQYEYMRGEMYPFCTIKCSRICYE